MKILCTYYYGGKPDTLNTISFCCDKMQEEIITYHEIKVKTTGYIILGSIGNNRKIKFCPYCGELINRELVKSKYFDLNVRKAKEI